MADKFMEQVRRGYEYTDTGVPTLGPPVPGYGPPIVPPRPVAPVEPRKFFATQISGGMAFILCTLIFSVIVGGSIAFSAWVSRPVPEEKPRYTYHTLKRGTYEFLIEYDTETRKSRYISPERTN